MSSTFHGGGRCTHVTAGCAVAVHTGTVLHLGSSVYGAAHLVTASDAWKVRISYHPSHVACSAGLLHLQLRASEVRRADTFCGTCSTAPANLHNYWTIDPFSSLTLHWRIFVTTVDATLTAFYLPISVAWHFSLRHFQWFNVIDFVTGATRVPPLPAHSPTTARYQPGSCSHAASMYVRRRTAWACHMCACSSSPAPFGSRLSPHPAAAGAIYLADFFMGFLLGFTVEHNLKRRVIMRPDLIMRCGPLALQPRVHPGTWTTCTSCSWRGFGNSSGAVVYQDAESSCG